MMPTDLVSVAPAGRDMTSPEADLASVVEARWHERSPRPNHCTLPGISALRIMFSSFGYSAWMFSLIHHWIGSGSPIAGPIGVAHKSSREVSCSFSGAPQSQITNGSVSDLQVRLPGALLPRRAHQGGLKQDRRPSSCIFGQAGGAVTT